jgi:hypothetical protein
MYSNKMNAARKPYKSPQVVQLTPIHHINIHTHIHFHVEKGLYYHLLKRMVFRSDYLISYFLCILVLLEQYGETRHLLQNDFTVIDIEVIIG